MPQRRILVIDGHPDADPARFVHALAAAYARGAGQGDGHEVRQLAIAGLDIPLLRSRAEWQDAAPPPAIAEAQEAIAWARHLVIVYPLWLGDMPALLKAFLEQVLRPDFAFRYGSGMLPEKLLAGRSARVIVTMGMPRFVYEVFYRAHSVKCLERNILRFVGIAPVRRTIIGSIETGDRQRRRWLDRVEALGRRGM